MWQPCELLYTCYLLTRIVYRTSRAAVSPFCARNSGYNAATVTTARCPEYDADHTQNSTNSSRVDNSHNPQMPQKSPLKVLLLTIGQTTRQTDRQTYTHTLVKALPRRPAEKTISRSAQYAAIGMESVPKIIINDTIKFFFLNYNQHFFLNFKP